MGEYIFSPKRYSVAPSILTPCFLDSLKRQPQCEDLRLSSQPASSKEAIGYSHPTSKGSSGDPEPLSLDGLADSLECATEETPPVHLLRLYQVLYIGVMGEGMGGSMCMPNAILLELHHP